MNATSAAAACWQAVRNKRMSPPVLFVIDNDTGVMGALRDDLSRRFGGDFRVIGESWRAAGLVALRQLTDRSIKRVASAVGDGATAVRLVHEYLSAEGEPEPLCR
jgi:hypothetical protein